MPCTTPCFLTRRCTLPDVLPPGLRRDTYRPAPSTIRRCGCFECLHRRWQFHCAHHLARTVPNDWKMSAGAAQRGEDLRRIG
ncbi:hypothetical protein K788_0002480 [Paraburkholderia caribensis MBA4]|uniref:Uncharacterized protein n=1 Tax=Paraburkholderia caribensis MBA4 TaxID=1323664 RepID=A0A0P0R9L9_9BURK|nr:hypothetical protein K788_0002480 [Paraburkholderia caribensis MBA4]